MSALAEFRAATLALLDDPSGDRYTNEQVDAALRWALGEYSKTNPLLRTYSTCGAGTWKFELPADFSATYIPAIWLDDGSDPPAAVDFSAYRQDEAWYIQTLTRLLGAADNILVVHDSAHTIDGLDGAAGTTIPANEETLLHIGAAGYAARIRAVSRAESINMQPEVRKQLQELAAAYLLEFRRGITGAPGVRVTTLPEVEDRF